MEFLTGNDWLNFLPAVQAFVQGQNPYSVGIGYDKVYEPFWTYILLAPFALLPFWVGRILLLLVSLIAFMYTAVRMGASRWQLIMFLMSASVIGGLYEGNIDWLVTMGLWMTPSIGLFFVLMKPQIGICIALYWAYVEYAKGGWKSAVKIFIPVGLAYGISFLVYGFWVGEMLTMPANPAGMGLFPYVLPIGLLLLYLSIRNRDKNLSIVSNQMIAPYVTTYNFAASLLALFNRPKLFILMWVVLWTPTVVRVLFH